jgi:GT2 family glycosyltransferase
MFVSVVIPFYKRKEIVLNTLRSFDKVDYPKTRYEIVLVEDGSNDFNENSFNTFEQCIRYLRSDQKKEQRTHFPPRNMGVSASKGELIIFFDCDQIVNPDFISQHVEFHLKHGDNVLQFGTRKNLKKNQDLNDLTKAEFEADGRKKLFEEYGTNGEDLIGNWANVWSHNISILRRHIEKHGGFDDGFTGWGLEDQELGFRMKKAGLKILYNPAIEVYHQYHTPAMGKSIFEGWMKNYEYFVKKYNYDLEVRAIRILGEILNTTGDRRVKRNKIIDISNLNYKRFELILRCIKNNDVIPADIEIFDRESDYFHLDSETKFN